MSRIGRIAITIPAGVSVDVAADNLVTVKGPKGTLTHNLHKDMIIKIEGATATVERPSDEPNHRALHGLTRTLLNNMVQGVSVGFTKELDVNGVGYRIELQGKDLVCHLGYSHPINVKAPDGIKFEVPNSNKIIISGADKQKVGQIAAEIREKRPPEPYLGKGIKYVDERIRRKAGKTGK